jgi:hypothetical protein
VKILTQNNGKKTERKGGGYREREQIVEMYGPTANTKNISDITNIKTN